MLLARIYEVFPLICPYGGGEIRIIAFITEPGPIHAILTHLGLPAQPPRAVPVRAPPGDRTATAFLHADDRRSGNFLRMVSIWRLKPWFSQNNRYSHLSCDRVASPLIRRKGR